ncbi:TetR/AcrR family transcriptional regulator [Luedemannella flava]
MPAGSIRARVRAEMLAEIKAVARRHLATDGANLSLRAVARDMGMVSSALYRYYASRDELLTALIIDAYDALGEAVERADASVTDRADARGRWLACCHAVRDWALAEPAEYALIFGSPVPGYAAPVDTVRPRSARRWSSSGSRWIAGALPASRSRATCRPPWRPTSPPCGPGSASRFPISAARWVVRLDPSFRCGEFRAVRAAQQRGQREAEYFAHQMTAVGEQLLGL